MVGDYANADSMAKAVAGCHGCRSSGGHHKGRRTSYLLAQLTRKPAVSSNTPQTRRGAERIVYLSIFGSRAGDSNPCLNSKGLAEETSCFRAEFPRPSFGSPWCSAPTTSRPPPCGPRPRPASCPLVGGGKTLQQPIDSRDVVQAILAALADESGAMAALDLCGPECLKHRELARPSRRPSWQGAAHPFHSYESLARLFRRVPWSVFHGEPTHHPADAGDPATRRPTGRNHLVCEQLGITLTPLSKTLRDYMGPRHGAATRGLTRGPTRRPRREPKPHDPPNPIGQEL